MPPLVKASMCLPPASRAVEVSFATHTFHRSVIITDRAPCSYVVFCVVILLLTSFYRLLGLGGAGWSRGKGERI